MKKFYVLWSIVLVATLAVFLYHWVTPATADVTHELGFPVNGSIPGTVTELMADEGGLFNITFVTEEGETLFISNGDPASGRNDLDQFGAFLMDSFGRDGDLFLQVANNNLVGVVEKSPFDMVWCCIQGLCKKVKRSKCDKRGTEYPSQAACQQNCT